MEELERIVAEAQIAGKSEEAIKNIIQAYKAANPFEFEAFLPKKTKLTPESISPGQITDTWIDDQGNPTGFSYPEVKITDKQLDLENQTNNANQKFQDKADGKDVEEEVVVKRKSIADKIKNVNIIKGLTLEDIFSRPDSDDNEEEEEEPDIKPKPLTAEKDATEVAKGNIPEVIEDETFNDDSYFDIETSTIKSDFDIKKVVEEEGEEKEKEVEEDVSLGDPADDLLVVKGGKLVYNIGETIYDLRNKNEREELLEESKIIMHNIPLNLKQAYYSTKLVTNKLTHSTTESITDYDGVLALATMDVEGGNLGFSFENTLGIDNSNFELEGGIAWISPGGEQVPLLNMREADVDIVEKNKNTLGVDREYYRPPIEDLKKLAEDRKANGWKVIYLRSGREVGYKYKAWQLIQFQKIMEIEAKKIQPEVSFVQGYKQRDASQFFGAGVLAVSSLIETMLPALLTRGASLYPQIVTPKYIEYNRERAKALYPNLPELEAIDLLLSNNKEEILVPLTIGFIEMSLESFGIRGITKAIQRMSPGAMKFVSNVALSGSREGMTEWGQLGTTIVNRERGKGKSYEEAVMIAWAAMSSEEGLENFLLGLVGGSFATTTGAMVNRALRMDPSSIRFVNRKYQELIWVKSRQITSEKGKEAVQRKIDKIIKELKDHVQTSRKLQSYLTKPEKARLKELVELHNNLRYDYEGARIDFFGNFEIDGENIFDLAAKEGISPTEYLKKYHPDKALELQIILDDINDQVENIHTQIEDIKNVANERLIDTGITIAKETIGSSKVKVFNTAEELETWLKDNEKKLDRPKSKYRKADGWEVGGKIYINKPVAIEIGAVSVAQHEVAHFLWGDKLRDEDGNITEEGKKIINDFINTLPKNVLAIITARIDANYNLQDPNVLEEYLTHYIDGIIAKEWTPSKKSLKILGDDVTSVLKQSGYENIKFPTTQAISDWLTGYVRDKEKKKGPIKRKEPKPSGAKTRFSQTDLEGPVKNLGKTDQATWDQRGANNAIAYIYGKLDGIIKNKITSTIRELPDFNEEDFIQSTYLYLIPYIRNFQVAQYNEDGSRKLDGNGNLIGNDNLWAYIMLHIGNKAKEALKGTDVTKSTYEISLQDDDSGVSDLESDAYVDIDIATEEDVTYTALRRILNIKRGDKIHKKIINIIEKVIPVEIRKLYTAKEIATLDKLELEKNNLEQKIKDEQDPKIKETLNKKLSEVNVKIDELIKTASDRIITSDVFYKNLVKAFQDALFINIKALLGGAPGKLEYKNFITNNAEALYNLFSQQVFNKQFGDFIVEEKQNISPTEVDQAIKEGKLPKDTPRNSGPSLFGKLPFTDDVKQKWIDNFLNPTKGRPASKQNSLIDLISYVLGLDATMEVINSKEFMEKNDVAPIVIATIGMKIDRGANVRFSDSSGKTRFLNSNTFNKKDAIKVYNFVNQEYEFIEELNPDDLASELTAEFPLVSEDVIALVVSLADKGFIENQQGVMFKKGVQLSDVFDQETKDQIKQDGNIRYNEDVLDDLNDAANILGPKLGPAIMDILGYDILGYISRVLNAAKRQKNPDYEFDKTQPQYLEDSSGDYISAPFFEKLEALKEKVKNSKDIKLPKGLKLEAIRLMNKKYELFQKIEKILFDGKTTGEFNTNLDWKKSEIAKLADEINEAGEANIALAKLIAKEIIKEDKISITTAIHLFQIQTNIVAGFRALTTLDLITILEGSQKPGENHPYFQKELEKARKAKIKSGKKRGELKYPTEELAIEAAIKALGTKGEHAAANANTMLKLSELKARYAKNKDINLDLELEKIFQGHGQIHGTKGTFADLDVFGTTNIADWLRLMLDKARKQMFSPGGKTAEEVVIEKQVAKEINEKSIDNKSKAKDNKTTSRMSNSSIDNRFNQILEENENIKAYVEYSDVKSKILGSKVVKFWDFIYPPSAYDLEMFLYRIIGKDTKGEEDLKFFKEILLDPYTDAYNKITKESQRVRTEYKALLKKLPKVKKLLSKIVPGTKFTYDQAVRVAIWTDMGMDMQDLGLSKADQIALLSAVNRDTELITFKNALKTISRNKKGYPPPSVNWTVENIAYDMAHGVNSSFRAEVLAEWKNNQDILFSEKNKRKLRAIYGSEYVEALEDMLYRMEYGRGKHSTSRIERNWNNWVNNSVGAIMFFNFRSAILQTISSINYVDWSDNSPIKAAKAFANQVQFWRDVLYIFNSDYLNDRRTGNKRTVNESELSDWLKGKKNKAKAFLSLLLEKGFTPTQIADSFAISTGGATYYRNKVNKYLKEGLTKKEAEERAWKDFLDKTEKGQQSSRPDLISQQQAGGLGRLILAFKNTPMQYNRLMIKAILDLKNNRGKTSENISKIAYYGLVQNIIFTSLQTALFAALGDEDEWDSKKERVANGMIDSILNGMGLTGAIAVTIKNGYLRYRKEKARGYNADHTRTIIEFANLSPTIGSKLRKLYGAIRTEQLNPDAIEAMGWNIENPAFNAVANLISATTNVPLDRGVVIAQNLVLASKDKTEYLQSLALILGWNAWDIGLEPTSRKVQQEERERKKKLKKKLKEIERLQEKQEEGIKKQEQEKREGKPLTCIKCKRPVVKGKNVCTVHEKKEQRKDGKEVRCSLVYPKGHKKEGQQCGVMTTNKSGLCPYHD